MAENFQYLARDINLQIQDAESQKHVQIPKRKNQKKST